MADDLASKYPGAKITVAGAQAPSDEYSPNRMGESRIENEVARNRSDSRTLAPYEKKAIKMAASRGGAGAGGGGADMEMMHGMLMPNPKANYKKGGKVKLFKHHDGIAQRGKTRA